MMSKYIHQFKSQEKLVEDLSSTIALDLQKAVNKKGQAILAVSGGSTPKPLFKALSKIDLNWKNIIITLCDERCVNNDDENSNAYLVKKYLLKKYAKKATFIPLFEDDQTPKQAVKNTAKQLNSLGEIDVIILGMGEDGHTASLFPENTKLSKAYKTDVDMPCIHLTPTNAPYERISLTLNKILNSKKIYLHFEGNKKQKVFFKAIKKNDIFKYPIASVFNQNQKDIQVYFR